MRVDEFLDALYETPRDWSLDDRGAIRRVERHVGLTSHRCPWTQVKPKPTALVGDTPSRVIWKAADNEPGHDVKIRRALLTACGLA